MSCTFIVVVHFCCSLFLIMDFSEASFIKWFWPKLVYIKARKADASALEKKKMITGKRMNQSYHSVTTLATCLMAIFGQGLFYAVAVGMLHSYKSALKNYTITDPNYDIIRTKTPLSHIRQGADGRRRPERCKAHDDNEGQTWIWNNEWFCFSSRILKLCSSKTTHRKLICLD